MFPIAVSPDIGTVPNIRLVEAKEAAHFLCLHRKDVQVYQVTVGELQTIVSASADTGKAEGQFKGDPRIVELVERYRSRMFSDRVPTNRPQPDPDMPNGQMKIPLKDGAIPVKMRPFPMSHGDSLLRS